MLSESGGVVWLEDDCLMKSLRQANFKVLGGVIVNTNGCDGHIISRYWKLGLHRFRHNAEPITEGECFYVRESVL